MQIKQFITITITITTTTTNRIRPYGTRRVGERSWEQGWVLLSCAN